MTVTINGTTGVSLADTNSVPTAALQSGAVTQAKLATAVLPVGPGQSWQNVTVSRALGTTYTNNTGRPIWVAVTGTGAVANAIALYVDSKMQQLSCGGTVTFASAVSGLVPAGSTYSVVSAGGVPALSIWYELS